MGNILSKTNLGNFVYELTQKYKLIFASKLDFVLYKENPKYMSKTYEYACTANDAANGYIYFGNITPTTSSFYDLWSIHYRVKVNVSSDITNAEKCAGEYDVYLCLNADEVIYSIFNLYYSTSYYPIYCHTLLSYDTAAKFDSYHTTNPCKIGVRIYRAWTPTTTRTYTIDIIELKNCTFEFPNNIETRGNVYSTTYYAVMEYNATSKGLQETGDTNDVTTLKLYYTRLEAGTNGLKLYGLCMQDEYGTWLSFTTTSGTAVDKPKNPARFRLGSKIYYLNASASVTAGSFCGHDVVRQNTANMDFRYSLNINNTAGHANNLLPRMPLYIVGTLDSDGYFLLDDIWWAQSEPSFPDNKIYIKVCESIYARYENDRCYEGDLLSDGTAYHYTLQKGFCVCDLNSAQNANPVRQCTLLINTQNPFLSNNLKNAIVSSLNLDIEVSKCILDAAINNIGVLLILYNSYGNMFYFPVTYTSRCESGMYTLNVYYLNIDTDATFRVILENTSGSLDGWS